MLDNIIKNIKYYFILIILFCLNYICHINCHDITLDKSNSVQESLILKNIKQITFTYMGIEKAGESYFSPDSKTIIFQAVPKGKKHYQIYTISLENSNQNSINPPIMVSTGKGACTCAYFRPDGQKIIFASSHEDPNIINSISPNQNTPGYNKDNGQYFWEFTPYMNIYEANPDGTKLKRLTNGPAYHAECAYSSDGSSIVFASNFSGNMQIYTMNSDGTNIKSITNNSSSNLNFINNTHDIYYGGPFFSPDNKRIIYRADYDKKHYLQIYCTNIDGTNITKLTNNNAVNWAPFWHPNGKVIAYTTSIHGHKNYQIYLLNINTGANYRLTYSETFEGLPSFNNEGTKITWTSKRSEDNTCQIFVADFTLPKNLE